MLFKGNHNGKSYHIPWSLLQTLSDPEQEKLHIFTPIPDDIFRPLSFLLLHQYRDNLFLGSAQALILSLRETKAQPKLT